MSFDKIDLAKPSTERLKSVWPAAWCACPGESYPGVFLFRLKLALDRKPEKYVIHITADQRYQFFVNGKRVCYGPARGDLEHWRYESVNIAPFLREGDNILSAVVWNFGELAPWAQISARTAFLVCGDTEAEKYVNTPGNWKCVLNRGWEIFDNPHVVVGPGERMIAENYPWGWTDADFDDSAWDTPASFRYGRAAPRGACDAGTLWQLVPRDIPLMYEEEAELGRIVRVRGLEGDLSGGEIVVPANSKTEILLDHGQLCCGYPEITFSRGPGAKIKIIYAEALWRDGKKGNRNEVETREITGYWDEILPDGGQGRKFEPLWWRTFRYLQMDIQTADQPLRIDDLKATLTGYPLHQKASFTCSDPTIEQIWKVGWHTARLCAAETYFDCPYYEQLQYVGDTRIQALVSIYGSGDDQLVRKAIQNFSESLIPEGLTQSRYPNHLLQIIPPFSLLWIGMIHDYWMLRDDPDFVSRYVSKTREILGWFEARRNRDGILGPIEWWPFVDWRWPRGIPPGAQEGGSSIITLQYAAALHEAADLEEAYGLRSLADMYRNRAREIIGAVREQCFESSSGLLADTPEKEAFSQHANLLGVLTGLFQDEEARRVMERILTEEGVTPCTFYFRYYLHRAVKAAGLGERYISLLEPWRDMLGIGLTTWAETPEPTRSDCHAWSASPNYDLLATVCGVEPSAPGFRSVRIEPHLGRLSWVKCRVPHPLGDIEVYLASSDEGKMEGWVILPEGLQGEFGWRGHEIPLNPGEKTEIMVMTQ
jgi:alpha-L-rhamnosidase